MTTWSPVVPVGQGTVAHNHNFPRKNGKIVVVFFITYTTDWYHYDSVHAWFYRDAPNHHVTLGNAKLQHPENRYPGRVLSLYSNPGYSPIQWVHPEIKILPLRHILANASKSGKFPPLQTK